MESKSEQYARQSQQAIAEVARWPQWMQSNLKPLTQPMTDNSLIRRAPTEESDIPLPPSPLAGWAVLKMQGVHRTGTRLGKLTMLAITLRYPHANGEYIEVTVQIDAAERLQDLVPFLLASQDLPAGIRIEIARTEKSPWQQPANCP